MRTKLSIKMEIERNFVLRLDRKINQTVCQYDTYRPSFDNKANKNQSWRTKCSKDNKTCVAKAKTKCRASLMLLSWKFQRARNELYQIGNKLVWFINLFSAAVERILQTHSCPMVRFQPDLTASAINSSECFFVVRKELSIDIHVYIKIIL